MITWILFVFIYYFSTVIDNLIWTFHPSRRYHYFFLCKQERHIWIRDSIKVFAEKPRPWSNIPVVLVLCSPTLSTFCSQLILDGLLVECDALCLKLCDTMYNCLCIYVYMYVNELCVHLCIYVCKWRIDLSFGCSLSMSFMVCTAVFVVLIPADNHRDKKTLPTDKRLTIVVHPSSSVVHFGWNSCLQNIVSIWPCLSSL